MDGHSSIDCNKGGERVPSSPKKRRRVAKSIPTKHKERRRGLGIAELERIRAHEEIKEYFKETHTQPPVPGVGNQGLVSTLV